MLDAALDLDLSERTAFLDRECAGDPELRREVVELLASAEQADSPLDRPVGEVAGSLLADVEAAADSAEPSLEGRRIGAYRVLGTLGRGGMGQVFEAERADGAFEQRVAIKVLRWEMASRELVERFRAERQILARLEHRGIARLIDGGVTDDGLPFLVMERVEGEPIDRFCDGRSLSVDDRLDLFLEVCGAVAFAHRALVVHRDLKPSNILVTPDGSVKLLDFGVAKLIDEAAEGAADLTRTRLAPVTPRYAAPEQLQGEAITTATDVWALGVLLYELLTGAPPFTADTSGSITRKTLATDPVRPSRRVLESGGDARLARRLRGDLDHIVLTALRKLPERRYGSADRLAEDVLRHRKHEPVLARPESAWYRLRKLVRRHRAAVAATAVVALALIAGTTVALFSARQSKQAQERAEAEAAKVREVSEMVMEFVALSDPYDESPGSELPARAILDRGLAEARARLADRPELQLEMLSNLAEGYENLGLWDESRELFVEVLDRSIERYGERSLEAAKAHCGVGGVHLAQQTWEAAVGPYRIAVDLYESLGAEETLEHAYALGGLASALIGSDRPDEAEPINRQALELHRRHLGDHHSYTLHRISERARLLRHQGDLEGSAALYTETLAARRALGQSDSSSMPVALNNLAFVRKMQGRPEESVPLYREALEIVAAAEGEGSSTSLMLRKNLASALSEVGGEVESEALLEKNLDLAREAYSETEPRRLWGHIFAVGQARVRFGKPDAAVPLFREAMALSLESRDIPVRTETVRAWLALSLLESGETDLAADAISTALASMRQFEGPGSVYTRSGFDHLAVEFERFGYPEIAVELREVRREFESRM